jgi:hypothetical protein
VEAVAASVVAVAAEAAEVVPVLVAEDSLKVI